MDMNWIQSLIYGLVSGFTEFVPISSQAHQELLIELFGVQGRDPFRDFVVHLSILFSLYSGCRAMLDNLRRENRQQVHNRRSTARTSRILLDQRFVKNATIPMLIGLLVLSYIFNGKSNLLVTAVFFLVNGIILFVPGRMMQGNKGAYSMSYMDSLLTGCLGALSAISGISRVACITSASIGRGANRQKALNWAFLLSIPALMLLSGLDVLKIISGTGNINFWGSFFTYIVSAAGAYIGGYYSIVLMKFLTVRVGFSGFSYYCWGASLFTFLLYLTIV